MRNFEEDGKPYYDHWSDKYMKLTKDPISGTYNLRLEYGDDMGFNFETIYLRWKLPKGFNVMDTVDRLGGCAFSSSAQNIVIESNNSGLTPLVETTTGHVVPRVHKRDKMYLGLEHSTTMRKSGFVLVGLASEIRKAIKEGMQNPTLVIGAIPEDEITSLAKNEMGIGNQLTGLSAPREGDNIEMRK